jgi:YD repeat-containing protein
MLVYFRSCTVINANNVTAASFTYDAFARIRTFTDSEGWTATYDYDAADRVTTPFLEVLAQSLGVL